MSIARLADAAARSTADVLGDLAPGHRSLAIPRPAYHRGASRWRRIPPEVRSMA